VINVSVISDYKECLQLTNLLKLAAGKFQKCAQVNEIQRASSNPAIRLNLKRRKNRFATKSSYDAEDYYRDKIERLIEAIQREREAKSSVNCGIAFVVFRSSEIALKMLDKEWFRQSTRDKLSI
jgi:hypothetical protein